MENKMQLNNDQYNALCDIIDMYHDIELKHYQEEPKKDHIWHSINTLSLFLKEIQMKEE